MSALRAPWRGAHIAIAMCSLLAGCASAPAAREAATRRHLERAIVLLRQRNDADSLAAAGLLSGGKHRDGALLLVSHATEAAPDRPDLLWLQGRICRDVPACDPKPIEDRLRALDPGNGAGWMDALGRATNSHDDAAAAAALAAIAHSERFDIYWTTLVARLSRTTASTQAVSLDEVEIVVIGYLAAQAIPAYGAASNACKGARLELPETLATCRGIARAFQNGDTYITESIGLRIAERVWPEDSAEWQAASSARRLYAYRLKRWSELTPIDAAHAQTYLSLCEQHRREQDVWLAALISAGIDPTPPPD
jgi:hypothetical protein